MKNIKKEKPKKHRHKYKEHYCDCDFCYEQEELVCKCGEIKN